jgi:hypothetical protein
MANHVRQQIRERIATDLTGLTTTGSRVYQSRVYPLEDGNLPGLIIYTVSEESEPSVIGPDRLLDRKLNLIVEGYCEATSNYDDTIDTICKEVEVAIAGDRTVNGLAKDSYLTLTDIAYNGEGSKPVAFVQMTFMVEYMVNELTPDQAQ